MKVYMNASFTGRKEYEEFYRRIYETLSKNNADFIAKPVIDNLDDIVRGTSEQAGSYFKDLIRWIKSAEVCVFEVSYPSTGIGFEIAMALQFSKPVVALYRKGAPQNVLIEKITDEKLQLVEYTDTDLEKVVKTSLDYATEQMDTRFNFFISPKIAEHLDWVSKNQKVPRAVYLRQLIEQDMENNEEYSG